MENPKGLSFHDPGTAAVSALRRWTRSPTGHRLGLRRSSTTSNSATSVTPPVNDEPQTSCVSRHTSRDDCALYGFIVWAAVKRNACLSMPAEARTECPLLHCKERFPNHELMLQHLYNCGYLTRGEYWCYDCGKAEQLNDVQCKRCLGHPSKRRRLMSMAKSFFSSLGHKPKNQTSRLASAATYCDEEPPSYYSVFTPPPPPQPQLELYSNEIHEIGSSEVPLSEMLDCDRFSQPPFSVAPSSHQNIAIQPANIGAGFMNWEPPLLPATVAPQNLMRPSPGRMADRPILQLHTHGLDQYRPQAKRRSQTLAPSSSVRSTSSSNSTDSPSSAESYTISPMSGFSRAWTKTAGLESALTSPDDIVSPGGLFQTDAFKGSYKPMPWSNAELDNMVANSCPSGQPADIPMFGLPTTMDLLSDSLDMDQHPAFSFEPSASIQPLMEPPTLPWPDSLIVPPPPTELVPQVTGENVVNAQSLVELAQDALQMHIADSMTKFNGIKENHLVDQFRDLSSTSVALMGLKTMIDVLEGRRATSPVKLLCFIHVVFSLSLVVHERNAARRCADLFKQAMSYGSWFSNYDRKAYIEAVCTLWEPGEVSGSDIISLLNAQQPGLNTNSGSRKGKEPEPSLQALGSDPLVFVAQYFLDDLGYSALHDDGQQEIQVPDLTIQDLTESSGAIKDSPFAIAAKFMIENVIYRQQHTHMPGFVASMQRIIGQVNSGQVSTVRRLELELMQAGKTHLPSDSLSDFILVVRKQVDSLYAQDVTYFSSRLTYHRRGVQLMESLIRGSEDNRTATENAVPIQPNPGSFDGIIGTLPMESIDFDFEAMVNLSPMEDIVAEPPDQALAVDAPCSDATVWGTTSTQDLSESPSSAGHGGGSMAAPAPVPEASSTRTKPPIPIKKKPLTPDKAGPPASTMVESDMVCELCGYRPKGKPQWFATSMAKHTRTMHSETPKIYRCPYPDCKSVFTKRADNLRQHQIEKGHFVDGQGDYRQRRKRKRTTETE